MRANRSIFRAHAAALSLLIGASTAVAQDRSDDVTADKSVVIPAFEIIAFDLLLSNYNRRFSGSSDYDVSAADSQ